MKASHDAVVSIVKDSLAQTAEQDGQRSIALKFSFGSLEQLASFRYNRVEMCPWMWLRGQ